MDRTSMVAALFAQAGNAEEVVTLREVPVPEPAPGEVLVQVQAASLQPADRLFIGGNYRVRPVFPQRAGLVGAGRVIRCGAGVELPLGTPVAFRQPGAWAECCAVPVDRLFVAPAGVPPESACQFALNPVTAWALLATAGVRAGDWVAVNAERSNVAHLVRHLAAARGVRVVDIPDAAGSIDGQGAAGLALALLTATRGTPVSAVLDAVGGPQVLAVMPALREGAVLVSYGVLDPSPAPIRNADLIYRNLSWHGFGIDHWLRRNADLRDTLQSELWRAIAAGDLPLPVRGRYPLGALHEALRADAAGGPGKVIVVPGAAE